MDAKFIDLFHSWAEALINIRYVNHAKSAFGIIYSNVFYQLKNILINRFEWQSTIYILDWELMTIENIE